MIGGPLVYAIDHCFGIKGQGTIMTGTILSGKVSLNDVSFTASVDNYIHRCIYAHQEWCDTLCNDNQWLLCSAIIIQSIYEAITIALRKL